MRRGARAGGEAAGAPHHRLLCFARRGGHGGGGGGGRGGSQRLAEGPGHVAHPVPEVADLLLRLLLEAVGLGHEAVAHLPKMEGAAPWRHGRAMEEEEDGEGEEGEGVGVVEVLVVEVLVVKLVVAEEVVEVEVAWRCAAHRLPDLLLPVGSLHIGGARVLEGDGLA